MPARQHRTAGSSGSRSKTRRAAGPGTSSPGGPSPRACPARAAVSRPRIPPGGVPASSRSAPPTSAMSSAHRTTARSSGVSTPSSGRSAVSRGNPSARSRTGARRAVRSASVNTGGAGAATVPVRPPARASRASVYPGCPGSVSSRAVLVYPARNPRVQDSPIVMRTMTMSWNMRSGSMSVRLDEARSMTPVTPVYPSNSMWPPCRSPWTTP